MRRYDIVTGILLILSIVNFALAAPVLVQDKRQAHVDVEKIPEGVTTVLGKRLGEELEKLGEEYFKTSGKSIDSSGTHLSSGSAPSGPDPGSTNDVQPPAQYSTSSTTNSDQLPCCPSSSTSMQGLSARGNGQSCRQNCIDLLEDMSAVDMPMHGRPGPMMHHSSYGAYQQLPSEPPEPQWIPMNTIKPSPDPNFDWEHWTNAEDPSPPPPTAQRPARPKMSVGEPSGHAPGPPPGLWPGSTPSPDAGSSTEPKYEVVPPPPSSDSELQLDHQSLSADPQTLADLEAAARYNAKGKAKQVRHVSGTARDAGKAA